MKRIPILLALSVLVVMVMNGHATALPVPAPAGDVVDEVCLLEPLVDVCGPGHAEQAWVAGYDGPASNNDQALANGVSPDGSRVFVAGLSVGVGSGSDFSTVAYDTSTGDVLWVARYNGPANGGETARALKVSPDGSRVFVAGESTGIGTNTDFATVAYDAATGTELWVARYNGPGNGSDRVTGGNGVTLSPDGSRIFVAGVSLGVGTSFDYATVAYDTTNGNELWVARYNGPGSQSDTANAVTTSPDGSRVFVVGNSVGLGTGNDYATVAYDAAGNELWVARYNGPDNVGDFATAVGVALDGTRLFVTGTSGLSNGRTAGVTVAYDVATGGEHWVSSHVVADDGNYGVGKLAVGADGDRIFIMGTSSNPVIANSSNWTTIAYDSANGNEQWVAHHDGPASLTDTASDLVVSPDGERLYATGASDNGTATGRDFTTIAYSAQTGAQLWIEFYNGPSDGLDLPRSIGLSADGQRIFVSGVSAGGETGFDYATVAYDIKPSLVESL